MKSVIIVDATRCPQLTVIIDADFQFNKSVLHHLILNINRIEVMDNFPGLVNNYLKVTGHRFWSASKTAA